MINRSSAAREAAAIALFAMTEENAWSDAALHRAITSMQLHGRDAALASRLVYGTIQNRLLCDWYLRQFSRVRLKKIVPRVLDCLRMGVYQLTMLDRIPAHAAVSETVALIRQYGKTGKTQERTVSFANAVLRRIAQAAENKTLPKLNCPDKESYYALQYSHPEWLVRLLSDQYGPKLTGAICQANNADTPLSVRVNLLKTTPEQMITELSAAGLFVERHPALPELLLCTGGDLSSLPAFREGRITVQDGAGIVMMAAAAPAPGMLVLDCCAAPGGKSFLAAERMHNTGRVISCDIYEHRLAKVRENAARLGLTNLETELADATEPHPVWFGKYDLVLCDVPCSGFGILRKKPEIRYRDPAETEALPILQQKILENCSRYVRPGGALVYSTCTILRRENEQVIQSFLSDHREFLPELWSHPVCGERADGMITLLPPVHQTDGFYIAKLRKKA